MSPRKKTPDVFMTLPEAADALRISRHTIQSWISPSSQNFRPEFARLVKHAGKKTIFIPEEIFSWVSQRGVVRRRILENGERSSYWFEKFLSGKGLLKDFVFPPEEIKEGPKDFKGGMIGLDSGPLLGWLTESAGSARITKIVERSEGVILPLNLASWILKRIRKIPRSYEKVKIYFFSSGIFELAPINEEAAIKASLLPPEVPDLQALSFAAAMESGAEVFATWNANLYKVPGLSLISP